MEIKQFIEKAVEGGWQPSYSCYEEALLDIKCWQAVGNVEGWGIWKSPEINASVIEEDYWGEDTPLWKFKMHQMIDALIKGKSIEEYIKEL